MKLTPQHKGIITQLYFEAVANGAEISANAIDDKLVEILKKDEHAKAAEKLRISTPQEIYRALAAMYPETTERLRQEMAKERIYIYFDLSEIKEFLAKLEAKPKTEAA